MHVKTHVVAQAVRHEQTADSVGNHLVQIALHKAQLTKVVQHVAHCGQVAVAIWYARLCHIESQLVALIYGLIDIPLLGGKLARCRIRTGVIRCIMLVALCTGVYKQQSTRFDKRIVRMAVEYFSVLGEDSGERHTPAIAKGRSFHIAHDLLLHTSYANTLAGNGMHAVAKLCGGIQQLYLAGILHQTHLHDGPHQRLACQRASLLANGEKRIRRHSKQCRQLNGVVVARHGQEVHLAAGGKRSAHGVVERRIRGRSGNARSLCIRGHAGHGAHPDYIVNLKVVGINRFRTRLQVKNGRKTWLIDPKIIQPVAVLTPFVTIVAVLGRRFHIAYKNYDALFAAQQRAQGVAPLEILIHGVYLYSSYSGRESSDRNSPMLFSSRGQIIRTSSMSITI